MSSEYFNSTSTLVSAGSRAIASHVNNVALAIETGLDKLPTEAQLKQGKITVGTDSGAADAYVVALPYTPASYADGLEVIFKASAANTGDATVNVNSLGVKSIKRQDGSALVAGDIAASKFTVLRYNSTTGMFEIQTNSAALSDATVRFPNLAAPVTASDVELNTLDGLTASTAELNVLDGVTASTAELNYCDGVTSAIQGQIDGKASLSGATFVGTINAPVVSVSSNLSVDTDGVSASATVRNTLSTYASDAVAIVADRAASTA